MSGIVCIKVLWQQNYMLCMWYMIVTHQNESVKIVTIEDVGWCVGFNCLYILRVILLKNISYLCQCITANCKAQTICTCVQVALPSASLSLMHRGDTYSKQQHYVYCYITCISMNQSACDKKLCGVLSTRLLGRMTKLITGTRYV